MSRKTEFDCGYEECMETKVSALYAKVEDAITDLEPLAKGDTSEANYLHSIVISLRAALKEADE